tara:strand:+ start:393 stop:623 length:231 start_codon:yes stop_codon:yes gene_type:complete
MKLKKINTEFDKKRFSIAIKDKSKVESKKLYDVAFETGLHKMTIWKAQNEQKIELNTILKICDWLKMPINDFLQNK